MLVLHTLPHGEQQQTEEAEGKPTAKKRRKLASPTDHISRLVSVVEIIKREFVALVTSNKAGEGNPPGTLLHQYNVLDCLETPETEHADILSALEGKN
jgi:hypothetical protein